MKYKIREIRQEKQLTQNELAMQAGCTRATINMLECGRHNNTTTKTLYAIARALGCTVDDLLEDEIDETNNAGGSEEFGS